MEEKIGLERRAWSPEAAEALQPALLEDAAEIAEQVKRGKCELWRVHSPGEGWVVTRFEVYARQAPELCLVAGAGRGYQDTLPHFVEIARANGAKRVRVHTHIAAIGRMLERGGFHEAERVYVQEIEQ